MKIYGNEFSLSKFLKLAIFDISNYLSNMALKKIIPATFFILSSFLASGQISSVSLLAELPAVPLSVCSADSSMINDFNDKIVLIKGKIKAQIKKINFDAENRVVDIYSSSVYSSSKTGISRAEFVLISKMSPDGREQWMREYASKSIKSKSKPIVLNQDNKNAIANLKEEKGLIAKTLENCFIRQKLILREIAELDSIETIKLKDTSATDYSGKSGYCSALSAAHLRYIKQCFNDIKDQIPLYIRLNEIENELIKREIDYERLVTDTDLYAVKAVDKYADILSKAYKYRTEN